MFQTFDDTASPEQGPARLDALRTEMARRGVDGFIIPRSDAHQGEYVAPRDDRLAWLTGFTGSAGWCVVLADRAAVFVDGRYRVQVKAQVAEVFEKVDWPEVSLSDWIKDALSGGKIAYDPWLISVDQLEKLQKDLPDHAFSACDNLVDAIWTDQPAPSKGAAFPQALDLAGEAHSDKIARLAKGLDDGQTALITLPDSIAWLLNLRGSDIPRNPVAHGFAMLHSTGKVSLYMASEKLADMGDHFGPLVTIHPPEQFLRDVASLTGSALIDARSCPMAVLDALTCDVSRGDDPVIFPKARKNAAELAGARAAHHRDALAMVRFLAWLDGQPPGSLTEIDVVRALESERRATNALRDISFETISGAGANGAIVHYRVTEQTNRAVQDGELLLVDSGGQYVDGTTDITRTIAIGAPGAEERALFTRVLKGMITVSRLRFPKGLAGRDIDPFARAALWEIGLDYGHGTGHGIGSYLCVHEGPQGISHRNTVPLEPGMLLSNEPGFYREGAFGIRIENLIAVQEADPLPSLGQHPMYDFETLTYVPIDTRLVDPALLSDAERAWLNAYHAECVARLSPGLEKGPAQWLDRACKAI